VNKQTTYTYTVQKSTNELKPWSPYGATDDMKFTQKLTLISYTHTHPFNGPLSRTTQVSRYQNGKTNLDFTEARESEWQWHQLGHMQVCTSL